jgi:DNA (cytosine-5)-methyltransferase 1
MATKRKFKVIDLFCGIGGLSHGLIKEGLDVVAGIDNDETCRFGYEYNNKAKFIHKDISEVSGEEINRLFGYDKDSFRVLVGCAPCQPFSRLNLKRVTKKQLEPVEQFAQLIQETLPDIVSMENVSGLAKMEIFETFVNALEKSGYKYKYEIVDASDYGVPQRRKRLVLLASLFGEIELIKKTHPDKKVTVRDVIKHLEPIRDGEASGKDRFHRASKLSDLNLRRIKATPIDGGNSRSWDQNLILNCHKKDSGRTYRGTVYGRMHWDEPAPTMTTQCIGLGNGRFGHPEQDRAISLREAAIFQTFPRNYKFLPPDEPLIVGHIAKFIGNAVPVRLGVIIGRSIKKHTEQCVK